MPTYRILSTCIPSLADHAITIEPSIGLLLACNVMVLQGGTGQVHVEFMDTAAALQLVNKPEIAKLTSDVRQRLERVMAHI